MIVTFLALLIMSASFGTEDATTTVLKTNPHQPSNCRRLGPKPWLSKVTNKPSL